MARRSEIVKSSSTKKRKPKRTRKLLAPGPRTVRAWFDTVINPLLKGLTDERSRLVHFNWTFQFRPAALESIRPVKHYVLSNAQANLEQFLGFYEPVKKSVDEHDRLVAALTEACRKLHGSLVNRSPLPRLYRELTSERSLRSALEKHGRAHRPPGQNWTQENLLSEIFGGYPPSDHLAVLAQFAQYIANHTGDLADHMTTAPFWNEYRERLLTTLQSPEVRRQYAATTSVGSRLMKTSGALSNELQEIRLKLSIEYDVPYVEPWSVESEGKWYVESGVGQGSTFTIRLPRSLEKPDPALALRPG
jgi:hypothetical protein